METVEIEKKLYAALISNNKLMDLLANADKSIFHLRAPSVYPALPFLVYSPISDVPNLHGDNKEFLHRVTFRVHIVHGDNDYFEIYSLLKNIMYDLGFIRVQATPFIDNNGVRNLITDFKIITGA